MNILTFFYLSLAAWRMASLVANEAGPWHVFQKVRNLAGRLCDRFWICREFGLYELLECEWCNSVWIGYGLMWLYSKVGDKLLYFAIPLALSTIVIVIKVLVQGLQVLQEGRQTNEK